MNNQRPDVSQQSPGGQRRLNVIIHGLWGIETNKDGIRLTTPHVHEHVMVAGKVGQPEVDLVGGGQRRYDLLGVVPGKHQDFVPDKVFRVGPRHSAADDGIAVEVRLPYPAEIRSLREFQTRGEPFFEGDVATPPVSGTVVQVLIYDIDPNVPLELKPSTWAPGAEQFINLHLYAQPPTTPDDPLLHVHHGFAALADAYGIRAVPLKTVKLDPNVPDPGIPGLRDIDLMALFELKGVTVSPPTCDMFIFDNT